jgi:hypothetical protein
MREKEDSIRIAPVRAARKIMTRMAAAAARKTAGRVARGGGSLRRRESPDLSRICMYWPLRWRTTGSARGALRMRGIFRCGLLLYFNFSAELSGTNTNDE